MKHATSFEETKVEDFKQMRVSSTAFEQDGMIPKQYTCDGKNYNPPLNFENIPPNTKTLALIVDDPDAPSGTWVHWVAWNIPVTHHLKENHLTGVQGLNDFGKNGYGGPCPPSGTHRYNFKVYALDDQLDLPAKSGKRELERAMSEHIIAFGFLQGKYGR